MKVCGGVWGGVVVCGGGVEVCVEYRGRSERPGWLRL